MSAAGAGRMAGILLALGAAGCAAVPAGRPAGEAEHGFLSELAAAYREFAASEADQYDWPDSRRYRRRALAAEAGLMVEPSDPGERDLDGAELRRLGEARGGLVSVLDSNARILAPIAAARAQASFDCWAEQQEEGWQMDDIARCRSDFDQALAEARRATRSELVVLLPGEEGSGAIVVETRGGRRTLDRPFAASVSAAADAPPADRGALAPAAVSGLFGDALDATPQPPAAFILYFEAGGEELTGPSRDVVADLLAEVRGRRLPDLSVIGHTDRAGAAPANERLARSRAAAVARLLREEGIPAGAVEVKSFGETDPLVPTRDGVAEPRNRRVEVMVR
ncbi:OmpA family protein [Skermanella sp. TT6]|uniref:OmpA family protein n=1 Tax=Skermanella cutis TaxID=2775420 RepID=A0ABX7B2Q1_9PROT|nr:OmpA family protein [Skermanella sp. TT6]QQP88599.1 OmpA family protein [Skermanella sp. TT6]